MRKGGHVYINTNESHSVLYVGVTSDLRKRNHQHRTKFYPHSFTARYGVHKLVYYKEYPSIIEAIKEEKRIKGGSRAKKIKLIESINPEWDDLGDDANLIF